MRYLILGIPFFLFACKKETVTDAAPSLIGSWKHYSGEGDWHLIDIYDNSEGRMEWYVDHKKADFTKLRTWYIKDNTIYFGKAALNGELYEVIDFPVLSTVENIENHDTLKPGKRYMLLDKGYYVEQ